MTFDILWTSIFDIECVHYTMETPSNVFSFTLHCSHSGEQIASHNAIWDAFASIMIEAWFHLLHE